MGFLAVKGLSHLRKIVKCCLWVRRSTGDDTNLLYSAFHSKYFTSLWYSHPFLWCFFCLTPSSAYLQLRSMSQATFVNSPAYEWTHPQEIRSFYGRPMPTRTRRCKNGWHQTVNFSTTKTTNGSSHVLDTTKALDSSIPWSIFPASL